MIVNRRMVGGDEHGPSTYAVSDRELRYLIRIGAAHLHELRICIDDALGTWPEVAQFLAQLPAHCQTDLDTLRDLNTAEADWIEAELRYLRNRTFHYAGASNWKPLRWAMRAAAEAEGEIVATEDTLASTSLEFADTILMQHFVRKAPEEIGAATSSIVGSAEQRVETLLKALADGIGAATRFVPDAVVAYLNSLSEDVLAINR